MDVALGPRERNRRRTRDARRRPVAAKSQSKLPHRAHAARTQRACCNSTMKITRIGAAGGEVLLAGQGDQTLPRASRPPAPPRVTSPPFVLEATSTRTPPIFCCRLWSVGQRSNNRIAQKAVNFLAAVNMTTITDMVARG